MTREEAKELLPIIQAFAEGKTIQVWTNDTWIDEEYPCFFEELSQFRIKPKSKYRPFKTKEECWNEMHKHPDFGWVRVSDKSLKSYYPISNISDYNNFNNMFKKYEFTDGEPFGIKEE